MSGSPLPAGPLVGRVRVPGSKSLTNRALVAAALLPGESRLGHPLDADDTRTLARCLTLLGARVAQEPGGWRVRGPLRPPAGEVHLDVGPAGTPARFLLAVCAALPGAYVLDGSERMRLRPMGPLVEALRALGAWIEPLGRDGFLPLRIHGRRLRGGSVPIRGDVSSQFVSALLLASPLFEGGLAPAVAGPLSSAAYVTLTRQVAAAFASGPADWDVPGDDSAACFPIAGAVASRGRVTIEGLHPQSAQPDAVFRSWAAQAGGRLSWVGSDLVVDASSTSRPLPVAADVDPAPDAALPLVSMLAFARGTSRVRGVARLAEKESDRLAAALDLLASAGARAGVEAGERPALSIDGDAGVPRAAAFRAHDDHRVAMAAAVLALSLPAGSTIDAPDVVGKSYPRFFDDWSSLTGGRTR